MGICAAKQRIHSDDSPKLTKDALENIDIITRKDSFSSLRIKDSEKNKSKKSVQSSKSNRTSISVTIPFSTSINLPSSSRKQSLTNYPMTSLIPQKIWDGQKELMKNENLRQHFIYYLLQKTWMEKVSVRLLNQIIKRRRTQDSQEILFNEYTLNPRSRSTSRDSREEMENTVRRCAQLKIKDS
jgi:hypothetical protein